MRLGQLPFDLLPHPSLLFNNESRHAGVQSLQAGWNATRSFFVFEQLAMNCVSMLLENRQCRRFFGSAQLCRCCVCMLNCFDQGRSWYSRTQCQPYPCSLQLLHILKCAVAADSKAFSPRCCMYFTKCVTDCQQKQDSAQGCASQCAPFVR